MADYFLKATDDSRAYRVTYQVLEAGGNKVETVRALGVAGAKTPDAKDLAGLDTETSLSNVLVDMVLGQIAACTVAEYKAVAKASIDSRW